VGGGEASSRPREGQRCSIARKWVKDSIRPDCAWGLSVREKVAQGSFVGGGGSELQPVAEQMSDKLRRGREPAQG